MDLLAFKIAWEVIIYQISRNKENLGQEKEKIIYNFISIDDSGSILYRVEQSYRRFCKARSVY